MEDDVKAEDVDVKGAHPGQIGGLQMDVTDVDARVDRPRRRLARFDPFGGAGIPEAPSPASPGAHQTSRGESRS